MTSSKKEFIEFMMSAGVLTFGNFTTKSGRRTPYFVNTGNYRTGAQIARLGSFYAALIEETTRGDFEALFGPAYKGIPIAVSAAGALYRDFGRDKPYFFNRKEEKDHGEGGSVVGYRPKDGDRVIITEDVITAGTAVRETMPVLRQCAEVSVPHMFISVDRCEVGSEPGRTAVMQVQEEFGIAVHAIIRVTDILEYLESSGAYTQITAAMKQYMQDYCLL